MRRFLVTLCVCWFAVGEGSVAAAPPTSSECTFDGGRTTCVSTSTFLREERWPVPSSGPIDGASLPALACASLGVYQSWVFTGDTGATAVMLALFTESVTTVRRGAPSSQGRILERTTVVRLQGFGHTADPASADVQFGCSVGPPV
jgi:hypothetical protein